MEIALTKIKNWVREHAANVLNDLEGPAKEAQILSVEKETGMLLPSDYKQFLLVHNGENGVDSILGDGNALFSCEGILKQYQMELSNLNMSPSSHLANIKEWKEQVADNRIAVKGAVKPCDANVKWLPLSCMNGDVFRYLDFDPAQGGVTGQIIEVDYEGVRWEVLASSFTNLLEIHAANLENGQFHIAEHGGIVRQEQYIEDSESWDMPEWLKNA